MYGPKAGYKETVFRALQATVQMNSQWWMTVCTSPSQTGCRHRQEGEHEAPPPVQKLLAMSSCKERESLLSLCSCCSGCSCCWRRLSPPIAELSSSSRDCSVSLFGSARLTAQTITNHSAAATTHAQSQYLYPVVRQCLWTPTLACGSLLC